MTSRLIIRGQNPAYSQNQQPAKTRWVVKLCAGKRQPCRPHLSVRLSCIWASVLLLHSGHGNVSKVFIYLFSLWDRECVCMLLCLCLWMYTQETVMVLRDSSPCEDWCCNQSCCCFSISEKKLFLLFSRCRLIKTDKGGSSTNLWCSRWNSAL